MGQGKVALSCCYQYMYHIQIPFCLIGPLNRFDVETHTDYATIFLVTDIFRIHLKCMCLRWREVVRYRPSDFFQLASLHRVQSLFRLGDLAPSEKETSEMSQSRDV